jgi:molybdate/tungstate transport system substrate-binding protein
MDYAWEYLSVAVQHDLKYIKLDDHINLGNYKYDTFLSFFLSIFWIQTAD